MKYIIGLTLFLGIQGVFAQRLLSPDQFLGYELGARYTPHHRVVDYFKYVAEAKQSGLKLQQYGTTTEGRALLLAVVSASENMSRLDDIRKNNLRMAGMLKDLPADTKQPSVVWLSYNVHGNEASSTEVAMKMLYELVSGTNADLNEWLSNTVVIIDPCLNPDGRDRYVNWFNQTVGLQPDVNPIAREHDEPWPGGRSNHYLFDLNRDWAWQTQVESQQRMSVYQKWMPQIHCDFHEQGVDAPYYFAPAAEPFHEGISNWQRSFQTTIGKNHARYFDRNGWLYFTKEIFDLFYPSYGDTYPIFNGSIGMTYEQAGHSTSGVAIKVGADTLTLTDRIRHHFTTGLSTIEVTSKNAIQVNDAYKKYFDDLQSKGAGKYKTYIISGSNNDKLQSLMKLLDKNNIQYGNVKNNMAAKGFDYFMGKETNVNITVKDLVVSTCQSKGNLVSVLFEPFSNLSDSVTYDITAWSLPYAYGLNCYAIREAIAYTSSISVEAEQSTVPVFQNQYGFLIRYDSWKDAALFADLIKKGIKLRISEKELVYGGEKYAPGTFILLQRDNSSHMQEALNIINKHQGMVKAITTGFMDGGVDFGSDKVHLLQPKRVVLVTGEQTSNTAVGEIWQLFEQDLKYPLSLVNYNSLDQVDLSQTDVIIFPDGYYKMLGEKDNLIKDWVKRGGKLIAMENAVAQMASADWGFKLKKSEEPSGQNKLLKYKDRERDFVSGNMPGAIYKLDLDASHPLAFGFTDFYYGLKMNTNLMESSKEYWNVAGIGNAALVSGYVGAKIKDQIKDGTLISSHEMGKGQFICFIDNPVFRNFWENGKMFLFNAVFLSGW
jgi:hypothetical protein